MTNETDVRKRSPSSGGSLKMLLLISIVGVLLVSNVASLVSDRLHNLMFSGLSRALLLVGASVAEAALRKSPTVRADEKLKDETARLKDDNNKLTKGKEKLQADLSATRAKADTLKDSNQKVKADLDAVSARNKSMSEVAEKNAKKAKQIGAVVQERLAKGVARNLSAIPAEAVPYLGTAVTIGVTALDVYDACRTVTEMNELLRMLGMPEENTGKVCGVAVPTREQIFASLTKTWQSSAQSVTAEMKSLSLGVPIPAVRLPTAPEVAATICPVVGIPTFCP